ncbi:hypothetical protein FHR71_004034 [Methylobacterium sp. RAS18]|nr:hypothetical protein [Methylobacterium sp. RAS18]
MIQPDFEDRPDIAAFNRGWVTDLWSKGLDTAAIAERTFLPEHKVCQILARLQDERHAARQQGGALA